MKKRFSLLCASLTLLSGMAEAQITVWTDGGQDSSWTNAANWSNGVPTSSSNVQIGVQPSSDIIGIDTGINTPVTSFTFNSTLPDPVQVLAFTAEQLTVNGAITNASLASDDFGLTVNSGANALYTGGAGGLSFAFLNINTKSISTLGMVSIDSGGTLVFDINSLASYGSVGALNTAGSTINITGHAGDTFDLTSGNFNGATLNMLPTLSSGLTWDITQFAAQGVLAVKLAPEPTTYALLALGLAGLYGVHRGQKLAPRT